MGRGSSAAGADELLYGRSRPPRSRAELLLASGQDLQAASLMSHADPRRQRVISELAGRLVDEARERDRGIDAIEAPQELAAWKRALEGQLDELLAAGEIKRASTIDPIEVAYLNDVHAVTTRWRPRLLQILASAEPPQPELGLLRKSTNDAGGALSALSLAAARGIEWRAGESIQVAIKRLGILPERYTAAIVPGEPELHLLAGGPLTLCGVREANGNVVSAVQWARPEREQLKRCDSCVRLQELAKESALSASDQARIAQWSRDELVEWDGESWQEFREQKAHQLASLVVADLARRQHLFEEWDTAHDELLERAFSFGGRGWKDLRARMRSA